MYCNKVKAIRRVAAGRTVAGTVGEREVGPKEPSNNTWKGPPQLMTTSRHFGVGSGGMCTQLTLVSSGIAQSGQIGCVKFAFTFLNRSKPAKRFESLLIMIDRFASISGSHGPEKEVTLADICHSGVVLHYYS